MLPKFIDKKSSTIILLHVLDQTKCAVYPVFSRNLTVDTPATMKVDDWCHIVSWCFGVYGTQHKDFDTIVPNFLF